MQSNIKKIYEYRSELVHGGKNAEHKSVIMVNKEISIPAVSLAIEYLQKLIEIMLKEPKYLESHLIDKELLLGEC